MAKKEKPTAQKKTTKTTPKKKHTPKIQQKKVLGKLLDNIGSQKQAMIEAGYSESYAKNPKLFRKTASFQQLLEENLPDWLLTEKHSELLDAKKIEHYVFPLAMTDEEITTLIEIWGYKVVSIVHGDTANRAYYSAPDNFIILNAVKEGYKIKNRYEPAEDTLIIRKYEDLSDEELARIHNAKLNKGTKKSDD